MTIFCVKHKRTEATSVNTASCKKLKYRQYVVAVIVHLIDLLTANDSLRC